MYQKITLEEALSSVTFPVYGLVEEIYGLSYSGHKYFPTGTQPITLTYQTQRYESILHEKVRGSTLSVSCGRNIWKGIPDIPQSFSMLWDLNDIPEPVRRNPFLYRGSLTIDGTPFTGHISYRPVPLCFSMFTLSSEQTYLGGQALGPDPDELIQILESLRVLNRKQAE